MTVRRSGIRVWHAAFFLLALLVCLVALAPASLVLKQRPGQLTFAQAEGSVWNATLEGAVIGGLDAGEVRWVFDPGALLAGAAGGKVRFDGPDLRGDMTLTFAPDGVRRVSSDNLAMRAAPLIGLPVDGNVTAKGLDIVFARGACSAAAGALAATSTTSGVLDLQGTAMCGKQEAWLPLEGGSGADRARIVVALRADGQAKWQADVVPGSVESAAALSMAGFVAAPGEPYVRQTRTFRWLPN